MPRTYTTSLGTSAHFRGLRKPSPRSTVRAWLGEVPLVLGGLLGVAHQVWMVLVMYEPWRRLSGAATARS